MTKKPVGPILILAIAAAGALCAQTPANQADRLEWFRDQGFGLFIHWSVDSQLGTVISHSLAGASEDYTSRFFSELPKTFNPRKYVFDHDRGLFRKHQYGDVIYGDDAAGRGGGPSEAGVFTTGSLLGRRGRTDRYVRRQSKLFDAVGETNGKAGMDGAAGPDLQFAELAAVRRNELATGHGRRVWLRVEDADRVDHAVLGGIWQRDPSLRIHGRHGRGIPARSE